MRVLFGMILGVALTIGVAFVHDTWQTAPSTAETPSATIDHRAMVNWDVVETNWRRVRLQVRETWTAMTNKINS
jgi:hypothetical protein